MVQRVWQDMGAFHQGVSRKKAKRPGNLGWLNIALPYIGKSNEKQP